MHRQTTNRQTYGANNTPTLVVLSSFAEGTQAVCRFTRCLQDAELVCTKLEISLFQPQRRVRVCVRFILLCLAKRRRGESSHVKQNTTFCFLILEPPAKIL